MALYALYKPYGMQSQFTREVPDHVTLADLEFDFPKDVYPIGRLDADSEGLLLLTNEKSLVSRILSPGSKVAKTYWAQVEGLPSEKDLAPLNQGIELRIKKNVFVTQPAHAVIISDPDIPARVPPVRFRKTVPDSWIALTLTEGKNRQVRKMCAHIGFPVLRLVRVQVGSLKLFAGSLDGMLPGEMRQVRVSEVL
jgi:23S rRNA pseudouridine2457 synthase